MLDKFQNEIVNTNKSCFVSAGPGSGKTKVVVAKALMYPRSITLSFGRKAIQEIKQRNSQANAYTIHSFCYRNLKLKEKTILNENNIEILAEKHGLEKEIQRIKAVLNIEIKKIFNLVSQSKNLNKSIETLISSSKDFDIRVYAEYIYDFCKIYDKLNKIYLDYDDLLIKFLENTKDVETEQLIIDEFQDVNNLQIEVLRKFVFDSCLITYDINQAIYGFRNANIEDILQIFYTNTNFEHFFLHTNYRSPVCVVEVANKIIDFQYRQKAINTEGCIKIINDDELNKYLNQENTLILSRHSQKNKNILTIHQAKGLEAERVVLFNVEHGIFPDPKNDIEEERRIFYVALTRTKRELFIHYSKKPSSFLYEFGILNKKQKYHTLQYHKLANFQIKRIKS
ncbi:MAG: UvrD-helicase domain-containing protein [Endomicrobia bacterium]|nr:UvrD-helicase domain-containing protein [Endomicrobiia bacterium]